MSIKIKLNKFGLLLLVIIISSCGFKVVDKSNINNYSVKNIITSGDIRINYKIKNSLLINSKKENDNQLNIKIETNKVKEIKEKNIKNEIVKYQVRIISNLEINLLKQEKIIKISEAVQGEYSVDKTYSTTLTNEKKLIESLTENLADKIQNKLNNLINDT
tara:strand:- start:2 stop:484 length:483 start_codon:yes stop_codon:yes gene_type:complete